MKINQNWFIISDLHMGHASLLGFGTRKQGFEEEIIKNWNRVVSMKDKVLMMGDFSLTNKEDSIRYGQRLNGEKYMFLGNHDHASETWYKECGFTIVDPIYKVFTDDAKNEKRVFFTHEPVIPLPEFTRQNGKNYYYFNVHGHMHGNKHHDIPVTDRHFDMSAESINLTPVRLSELIIKFNNIVRGGGE